MSSALQKVLIGILVFGLVAGALGMTYASFGTTYGIAVNPNYSTTYSRLQESNSLAINMTETISTSDVSTTGGAFSGMTGIANALKLTFNEFGIMKGLATDVGNVLHIPPIFIGTFIAIVLIVILFAIIIIISRSILV